MYTSQNSTHLIQNLPPGKDRRHTPIVLDARISSRTCAMNGACPTSSTNHPRWRYRNRVIMTPVSHTNPHPAPYCATGVISNSTDAIPGERPALRCNTHPADSL